MNKLILTIGVIHNICVCTLLAIVSNLDYFYTIATPIMCSMSVVLMAIGITEKEDKK